jgi:nucleotide-binding universal stress UspA family protein
MSTPSPKPLADIACIIRAGETLPEAATQQAIALATAHGSHLTLTIATQHLATPYSPIWTSMGAGLVKELNARAKAKADEAADSARTALRIAGVNGDIIVLIDSGGDAADIAVRAARASDLIVVDQPDAVLDARATILEEALFRSGRPVMVATPKRAAMQTATKAMLAWDGTAHAARAASDLIGLFPSIKHVDLVSVMGDKDMARTLPGADFARHLSRKRIDASIVELSTAKAPVATLLDAHATSSGADIIAMGGYGHSRLRQFVLGGVTVSMIQSAGTPLLMAY